MPERVDTGWQRLTLRDDMPKGGERRQAKTPKAAEPRARRPEARATRGEPLPACLLQAGRCSTFAGVVKRLLAVKREGCEAIAWAQVFYRDTLLGLSPTMDGRRLRAGVFKLKSKGVTQVWVESKSRRYGLIMKDFLVGKGDFSGFLNFGGFRGIFGKL